LPGSFFCAAISGAKQLGLRSESDVFIVDDVNRFPDGMDKDWDEGQDY
jgi:N-acetylglucosaminylphosphatidylinositol deacetylase